MSWPSGYRALSNGVLLPFLCLSPYGHSAKAQAAPAARHDACADGIVSYQGGVNGQVHLCGAILQADPKLSDQMDQLRVTLAQQHQAMERLTRSVNAVGKNLDLTREIQMLQSLVAKLGTNPESATTRAGHLATALEGVDAQISSVRDTPADAALLENKLHGTLGDAIAQLDTGEATAELNDIRAEVHKIDETTTRTEKDVRDMRKTIDLQLHPERALPPEEGKLYTQMSPLMMELSGFATRWQIVALQAYQDHTVTRVGSPTPVGGFAADLQKAFAPILADYQNLLPQMNVWRSQLVKRTPGVTDIPPFEPVTDQIGIEKARRNMRTLSQQYATGVPNPSPDLARQGHELEAKLMNFSMRMREAYQTASATAIQNRAEAPPVASYHVPRPGQDFDESVDGPMRKDFLADLEPRLQAWEAGVKKFFPDFKVTDFSGVRTSHELQQSQLDFNQQVMRFYRKVTDQVRAASDPTP